jgi:hypothetical protein
MITNKHIDIILTEMIGKDLSPFNPITDCQRIERVSMVKPITKLNTTVHLILFTNTNSPTKHLIELAIIHLRIRFLSIVEISNDTDSHTHLKIID